MLTLGNRSTPASVTAVNVKDPGRSAQSAGGRSQLYTHGPYVCSFESNDTEIWCMVVSIHRTCTETAAVSHGTRHPTAKQRCKYTAVYRALQQCIQNRIRLEHSGSARREPVWSSGKALDW